MGSTTCWPGSSSPATRFWMPIPQTTTNTGRPWIGSAPSRWASSAAPRHARGSTNRKSRGAEATCRPPCRPIPAGTPIDLLANFDPLPQSTNFRERLAHDKAVVKVVVQLVRDLKALPQGATDDQARQVFSNAGEQLFALSKCPDYVVNRGHYFGSNLGDADKKALIAFLKTF